LCERSRERREGAREDRNWKSKMVM
jgi:hypothetical protein